MPSQPSLQTCLPCQRKFRFSNRLHYFEADPNFGLVAKNEAANFNVEAERGKAMGQLLLLLGKLAGLIALIVVPLALTLLLTLSHVTFPLSGVGEMKSGPRLYLPWMRARRAYQAALARVIVSINHSNDREIGALRRVELPLVSCRRIFAEQKQLGCADRHRDGLLLDWAPAGMTPISARTSADKVRSRSIIVWPWSASSPSLGIASQSRLPSAERKYRSYYLLVSMLQRV